MTKTIITEQEGSIAFALTSVEICLKFQETPCGQETPWRVERYEMPGRPSSKAADCRKVLSSKRNLRVHCWDQGYMRKGHNVH